MITLVPGDVYIVPVGALPLQASVALPYPPIYPNPEGGVVILGVGV